MGAELNARLIAPCLTCEGAKMHKVLPFYIGGHFVPGTSGPLEPVINPADGSVAALIPHVTCTELDDALAAAERGFAVWRSTSAFDRAQLMRTAAGLLRARAESIAAELTREEGKPLVEAGAEVSGAVELLEWYAEECRRAYGRIIPSRSENIQQSVLLEPVGPVAALTPWNFPFGEPLQKIAGALAAGCSIVVKPSEETPLSCLAIAQAFHDAHLPSGVLNVIFGVPGEISSHLVASPVIRMITFTGSTKVGSHLSALAAAHVKPCLLELGGHAPVIVCQDANIDDILPRIVKAKFRNAGQVCTSPSRFFVHESLLSKFVQGVAQAVHNIRMGNGADPASDMGPLANTRRRDAMANLTQDAIEAGAQLVHGGRPIEGQGIFWEPTVLQHVPERAKVMNEEPFGPIVPILPFASLEDVIGLANALPFGLAAYAFTRSAAVAARLSRALDSGNVSLNHFGLAQPETPFGGVKASGYGREGGSEGLLAYSRVKFLSHFLE
jgi:succinate-semialdehyde dehydrogenase / glutarate-semialdehyde dehydrogenase